MTPQILRRQVARVFVPLLEPARYKGAHGGRGSGKSHLFAENLIDDSLYERGLLSVCIREVQRTLAQSSKRLIENKLIEFGLGEAHGFRVFTEKIETPGDGIIIFQGMQDHTAESIKSLEGFKRAWWEEAQTASDRSLTLLRPTMRADGSEMWFSWNPKTKPAVDPAGVMRGDAVDVFLRDAARPAGAVVVEANFEDNPWFPKELAAEEAYDRAHRQPEDYAHIWRGAYQTRSEARVFRNWKVAAFDTPARATFRFGGDFGFAVDPSVLVRCFIGRWVDGQAVADDAGRTLFIDFEAYRVGCDVDHTAALFAGSDMRSPPRWANPYGDVGIPGALDWPITADSARPETISWLFRHGFTKIRAAKKGAGSVEEGVEFLKAYDIIIHPRCAHTIDEFTFYSFKTDPRTGVILPLLEDKKNHVIDSCRYAVEDVRRARGFFG